MPHNTHDKPSPSAAAAILAGWTLNPAQQAFLATQARFSFYVGGVGAGKTTAGALRALTRALDHPGSLGVIGAPTYPMLRDATQRTFFALLPEEMKYTYHKVEGHLTLENGSEILFRSLDAPDRLRGLNLAWFWLDEAPLCGYYAWQILKARLRQRGYATAGWATGTPKGRDGFARDFELTPRPAHALYRAATSANAANLPPDYIEDIGLSGALYDQEVLGLFTAFEGLVYAFAADLTDGHIHEPEPVQRFARIIGGVDWGYANPTAACVFGLDGDDRAWQLDEYYQRRAPLDAVVLPALVDLTQKYGVTTWYCGPDEPEHIAALQTALLRAGLSSRALPAEDAVRPGIQTITRLLGRRGDGSRGLSVAPRCVHTIAEYGMYQYPPDPLAGTSGSASGSPLLGGEGLGARSVGEVSELPMKQNDHLMDACFVAGTLIETRDGARPIETIKAGDEVVTRKGYRRVVNAGVTNPQADVLRVTFSDGSHLLGTANHPIYVQGLGYTPLRALRYGHTMITASQIRQELLSCAVQESPIRLKQWSTKGLHFADTLDLVDGLIVCTSRHLAHIVSGVWADCTKKSGKMPMGKYPQDMISIIAMAIRSTMHWKTWSVWLEQSTTITTCRCLVQRSAPGVVSGSIASDNARRTGTSQKMGVSGIESWVRSPGKSAHTATILVSTAGRFLRRVRLTPKASNSAPMHVSLPTDEYRARTTKSELVLFADNRSRLINTPLASPAPVRVVSLSGTADDGKPLNKQAVYNLEVEDAHEYCAQGVLVHNCRYALHTALARSRATDAWMAVYLTRRRASNEPGEG